MVWVFTMAYVRVEYASVRQLVDEFQVLNFYRDAVLPNSAVVPNFVLIDPSLYFGTYGGLVTDTVLQRFRYSIHETHSVSDSIGYGLNIVWWNLSHPLVPGDVLALKIGERVAVTPKMFSSIRVNVLRRKKPSRSSYYATKAWTINAASSSNSDFE